MKGLGGLDSIPSLVVACLQKKLMCAIPFCNDLDDSRQNFKFFWRVAFDVECCFISTGFGTGFRRPPLKSEFRVGPLAETAGENRQTHPRYSRTWI